MNTRAFVSENTRAVVASLSLACLAAAAVAPAAIADTRDASPTMKVSLADVDLGTEAGRATAYERVHRAARRLCLSLQDSTDLTHAANYAACVEQATAQAAASVDALSLRRAATRIAGTPTR